MFLSRLSSFLYPSPVQMSDRWIAVSDPQSFQKCWVNFAKQEVRWDNKALPTPKKETKRWKPDTALVPFDECLPSNLFKGLCYLGDSTYFGRLSLDGDFESTAFLAVFKSQRHSATLSLSRAGKKEKEWTFDKTTLGVFQTKADNAWSIAFRKHVSSKEETSVALCAASACEANAWKAALRQNTKYSHFVWRNRRLIEVSAETTDAAILRCFWDSQLMACFRCNDFMPFYVSTAEECPAFENPAEIAQVCLGKLINMGNKLGSLASTTLLTKTNERRAVDIRKDWRNQRSLLPLCQNRRRKQRRKDIPEN